MLLEEATLPGHGRKPERSSNVATLPRRRDIHRYVNAGWKLNWLKLLTALLGISGVLVFMYPSTAAWWSQYNESKVIDQYLAHVQSNPYPGYEEILSQAHLYNSQLSAGAVDIGGENRVPFLTGDEGAGLDYWGQLPSDSGMMGRLNIPAIMVDLPIYHGTSDEVLAHGVGHLQGTSLPVGGIDTHSVLTAHTGLATAELFNNLNKLVVGDTFTVSVGDQVYTYAVRETETILPHETGSLLIQDGQDLITLVTCTPLGINTHRYLVTGERITPTPTADLERANTPSQLPGFPWWAVIIPGAIGWGIVYVWRGGRQKAPAPAPTA